MVSTILLDKLTDKPSTTPEWYRRNIIEGTSTNERGIPVYEPSISKEWNPTDSLAGTGEKWITATDVTRSTFDNLFGIIDDETAEALVRAISELRSDLNDELSKRSREMFDDSS